MDLAFFEKKADRRDSYNESMLCNFSKGGDKKCAKTGKKYYLWISRSKLMRWNTHIYTIISTFTPVYPYCVGGVGVMSHFRVSIPAVVS